jgi:hypothetical protein
LFVVATLVGVPLAAWLTGRTRVEGTGLIAVPLLVALA